MEINHFYDTAAPPGRLFFSQESGGIQPAGQGGDTAPLQAVSR